MESIIKRVLKDVWPSVQADVEKLAADKVKARIEDKKTDVLANINGVDVDKMKEITSIKGIVPLLFCKILHSIEKSSPVFVLRKS